MSDINSKITKRLLIFGGTDAAYYFVANAVKKGFEVIVFSDPFRLSGKINDSQTLREVLIDDNIEYVETAKIDKDLIAPYINDNTLGFSIVTFWIFNADVINLFNGKFYNYHGALLPEEKGGGTFTWKILSQSYNGGLTVHKIDEGLDTGALVLESRFTFPDSCIKPIDFENFKSSHEKDMLDEFLLKITESFSLDEFPQKPDDSFYWPLLNTNLNGVVDWSWSCDEIRIFINAFDEPYEGASTKYGKKRVYLKSCSSLETNFNFHPFQSGIIIRKDDEGIYLSSSGGILKIGIVLNEKHENITQRLKLGERLYSTPEMIRNSFGIKAKYGLWGVKNKILKHTTKNIVSMHDVDNDCADMLHEIFTDKELCLVFSEALHKSISDTKRYLSDLNRRKKISGLTNVNMEWIVQTIRSSKAIGLCRVQCDFTKKEAFLNIAAISSYNSDEVMHESYEIIIRYCLIELNLQKLVCLIPSTNKTALEMCKELGFHQEDASNKVSGDKGYCRLAIVKNDNNIC